MAFASLRIDAEKFKDYKQFDFIEWDRMLNSSMNKKEYEKLSDVFPMYDLTFIGLVSSSNPIVKGVKESVEKIKQNGVKVVMISNE
jgi:magnesium-transporting ATPase (P-type)